ncbi:hypothetical protein Barb6_01829 [Bacteroidales bacterium Barb6]|nr:hypothetical protein Barb6_01829 [Bacteroidales bacterium Barb6]
MNKFVFIFCISFILLITGIILVGIAISERDTWGSAIDIVGFIFLSLGAAGCLICGVNEYFVLGNNKKRK